MIEAATSFRKNSFNDSDSATLAKVAAMFTNVADEAMSASDSASFIIAQMKAFNIDASNAEHIIDAVNSVSNHYAVSSGQLAQNLGNMSAAMATGNNTFEQSLGMLTAMTEITRNAAKGSRALITVQGRLNQIVDESSDTGKALTKWYQEHKIAVKDDEGQIRSLYDVLTDVAEIWPTLTKNEQMYYLQQQAGTTQTQNLAALLSNYETAIQATNTAIESNGSAMQENERYMESLQAKEQALKAEFEDFSNRVLSQEFVGGLLDAGKAMLNFANNDVGAAITRIGAFSTSVVGVVGIIGTVVGKLSQLSSVLSAAGGATGFLGTLLAPKTLLIIAGVAAAIGGIAEVIKAVSQAIENNKFENLVADMDDANQELENTKAGYEETKKKLDELNNTPYEGKESELQAEREQLNKQIEAYEKLIKLRQSDQVEAARKVVTGGKQSTGAYVSGLGTDEFGNNTLLTWNQTLALTREQAYELGEQFKSVEDATSTAFDVLEQYINKATQEEYNEAVALGNMEEAYLIAQNALTNLGVSIVETKQKTSDWAQSQGQSLAHWLKYTQDVITSSDYATQQVGELLTSTKDYYDALKILADNGENLDQWQVDFITNWESLNGVLDETNSALSETNDVLDEQGNELDELSLSVKATAQNLIDQAGQIDTTTQSYRDLVAQEIIFNNTGLDVSQKVKALQLLIETAGVAKNTIASIGSPTASGMQSAQKAARSMGLKGKEAAKWAAEHASEYVGESELNDYYTELSKLIDESNKGKSSGGGGSGSVKKSIDKTAEYAEKKAKEAAEKAAQEAEQAAKEAAEKAKEQINKTFDELKEAEEAYWDAKIDALETQNKLIDRQTRLEEKLKALQEAKQKKILLYKDGRFQYSEDVGAIASAQQDYNETWRDIYVEEQTEILNDLKDKALAIIEEYRDKALENGELTQENINSLLSEYHELGNNTYQTVAYGVENITNIVASGMSALTGSVSGATSTATSAISGTMGTIGSSMSKMATGLTSAASLLNKQFGEGLSAILKTSQVKSGKMVGTYQLGENEQTLDDFRNEYWGDTSGKFSKLSLLYGGGQSWWLGMMSKYLEDPEKNANLKIGSMTLKELYDTDWTKKVGSASSLGEIDDYIAREQAKYILNGGSRSDYEALNKIAQDAYRELYFKNPRAYAPGAKGYGGYDPEFSAAQYAVDAALRYSGSNYDVFGVEGGRTSGMSAGRVSDLNFLRELVSQGERAGASSISQTQAEWAKNQLNERYQTSYKNTLDAIDKQIEENSKKWYTADAEERDRLHLLNEELRKNRGEYEKKVGGNANGTLSWRGGLSVVGEKGPELRVLNKGDGIIPSNITENLWKIGSDPSKFMRDVVRTTSNIFSISSLSLPNARDAQSLVDGLQELAHQYVAKRK